MNFKNYSLEMMFGLLCNWRAFDENRMITPFGIYIAQAHQTPERSVGGMVPPVVGNSGSEEMR